MTVEETCRCGASLKVSSNDLAASLYGRRADEAQAWGEIAKWRDLHSGCREQSVGGSTGDEA